MSNLNSQSCIWEAEKGMVLWELEPDTGALGCGTSQRLVDIEIRPYCRLQLPLPRKAYKGLDDIYLALRVSAGPAGAMLKGIHSACVELNTSIAAHKATNTGKYVALWKDP